MKCAVRGCNNQTKSNSNIGFYPIPYNEPELCKKWVEFCGNPKDLNPKRARVCGDHFRAKDKERNLQYEMGFQKFKKPKLKPGTVPCIQKQEEEKGGFISFPTVMLNDNSQASEQMLPEAGVKDPGKDPLDEEEEKKKFNIKYVTLNGKQMIGPAPVAFLGKPKNKGDEIPQPQPSLIGKPNNNNNVPPTTPNNFRGILAVLYPVDETGKAVQGLLGNNSINQGLKVNPAPIPTKTIRNEDHVKIKKLTEENDLLKKMEKKHKEEIRKLEIDLMRSNFVKKDLEKKLKTLFSSNQIRQLKTGRRVIWSEKDMAQSVKLYQTSPAAYRLLKEQKYPLPSLKSVQTWIQMCKHQLREIENSKVIDDDEPIDDLIEECGSASASDEPEQQNTKTQNSISAAVRGDHDYLVVD